MASAHAWKRLTDEKYWLVVVPRADTSLPLVMSEDRNNRPAGNQLPRSSILRGKDSFNALFSSGTRISGNLIDLRFLIRESNEPIIKVAFITGKKIGNAVTRNRCKRLLREAYRLQQHFLDPIQANRSIHLDMALIPKSPDFTFQDSMEEVRILLLKLVEFITRGGNRA